MKPGKTNTQTAAKLLALALLTTAVLHLQDAAQPLFARLTVNTTALAIGTWLAVCVLWGAGFWLVHRLGKGLLPKPDGEINPLLLGAALFVCLAISINDWGGFRPYLQLASAIRTLGPGLGIVGFVMQYIYYAIEAGLMLLIILYSQRAGELIAGKQDFWYGSAGLVVLWGLYHIFSQGLVAGLTACLSAIFIGFACLATQGKPRLAYLAVFVCLIV